MRAPVPTIILAALFSTLSAETQSQEPLKVQIDFDTKSDNNMVELAKASIVSVAIISAPGFRADKVIDDSKLYLNGVMVEKGGWGSADHAKCSDSDINGDDVFDVVCKFDVRKLGLKPGRQDVVVTGMTISDGTPFEGRDSIVAQ